MRLTRRHAAAFALVAVAITGLFPPWETGRIVRPTATTPAGYGFIGFGPIVDIFKYLGDQRASGEYVYIDPSSIPREEYRRLTRDEDPGRFTRIDVNRLLIQWVTVAALLGLALLVPARQSDRLGDAVSNRHQP